MKQCTLCLKKEKDDTVLLLHSSCRNPICSECRYKEVVHNYENLIKTTNQREVMKMKCISCENASYSLNNAQIYDYLKQTKNLTKKILKCEGVCGSDDSVVKFYCKNCRIYLCMKCFTSNCSDHDISNKLNKNFKNMCSVHHQKSLKFECNTCSIPICMICKDLEHNDHDITDIRWAHLKKIENIKSNLPFPKYENLCEYLDKEKVEILKKLQIDSDMHIQIFEKLISKIQDMIYSFKIDITELKENLEISVKNLKISFQRYYEDVENIKSDDYSNIHSLSKLSIKKIEFRIRDNMNDSINYLISQLYSKFDSSKNEIPFQNFVVKPNVIKDKIDTIDTSVKNIQKLSSFQMDKNCMGILELTDGKISCWTTENINLINYNLNNRSLESIKTFHYKTPNGWAFISPIQVEENFIYTDGRMELRIWDKYFNLIQTLDESDIIYSLCSISSCSFAVGINNGPISIYSRNEKTKKYQVHRKYIDHTDNVYCLLYIHKHDLLLSGSSDKTINVFKLFQGKSINKLSQHNKTVFFLISLDDDRFANSSFDGVIKIWYIKQDSIIECLKTILAYRNDSSVYLKLLENEIFISYIYNSNEFRLWDLRTYKHKVYREDTGIIRLIVTKNNTFNFITYTSDKKVNVWKILESENK